MSLLLALTIKAPQAVKCSVCPKLKMVLPEPLQSCGAGKPVEACLLGGKLIVTCFVLPCRTIPATNQPKICCLVLILSQCCASRNLYAQAAASMKCIIAGVATPSWLQLSMGS